MTKFTTGAGIALLAAFLFFAAPSDSQAQGYRYGGHTPGSSAYGGYGSGYGSYGTNGGYGRGGYGSGYSGYGAGSYGYGRPTLVHPETLHWTPYRGLHTHGHMHVPHRGHSHVRPY